MGGPFSGTMAQIYLNSYEVKHIMNIKNPFYKNINKYFRCADDTFFVFTGTDRTSENFMKSLNSINENIKFTMEKMKN